MIASLRIPSVIGALGDVDRGTWVKACLGVGTTAVLLKLARARLEKKAYWARWAVIFIYITSDICMVYMINTSVICIVNVGSFAEKTPVLIMMIHHYHCHHHQNKWEEGNTC